MAGDTDINESMFTCYQTEEFTKYTASQMPRVKEYWTTASYPQYPEGALIEEYQKIRMFILTESLYGRVKH